MERKREILAENEELQDFKLYSPRSEMNPKSPASVG